MDTTNAFMDALEKKVFEAAICLGMVPQPSPNDPSDKETSWIAYRGAIETACVGLIRKVISWAPADGSDVVHEEAPLEPGEIKHLATNGGITAETMQGFVYLAFLACTHGDALEREQTVTMDGHAYKLHHAACPTRALLARWLGSP